MDINTIKDLIPLSSFAWIFFLVIFILIWAKIARYSRRVHRLQIEQVVTNTILSELRTEIATLKESKIHAQKFIDKNIYKSSSSLSLTKIGVQLIENSGFVKIFEKEKNNLATMLGEKQPKTKYDVQEKARYLMDSLQNYTPFESIKSYAYNHGQDFGQILRAGAILLRDYYLSLHPEILT